MARAAFVAVVALAVPPWGGGARLEAARAIPDPSAITPARPSDQAPGERPDETLHAVPVAFPPPDRVQAADPDRMRSEQMRPTRSRSIPAGTGRAASVRSLFDYSVGRFLRW